jgi:hypothetical protein
LAPFKSVKPQQDCGRIVLVDRQFGYGACGPQTDVWVLPGAEQLFKSVDRRRHELLHTAGASLEGRAASRRTTGSIRAVSARLPLAS